MVIKAMGLFDHSSSVVPNELDLWIWVRSFVSQDIFVNKCAHNIEKDEQEERQQFRKIVEEILEQVCHTIT